ncbi:monocarboxylate transporter 6-like [Epargyreus clarus]|uniref:monocarboxylate transporter 6-like n=1 Tax=Epargyreus clarus TaxID=520877 RepID=UPI003C2E554B
MDRENKPGYKSSGSDSDHWGYVVCFGTIITFIAGIGHVNSFGLIYNDFIIDTQSTAKSLTTAYGVFAIMLAIGGLILNVISKKHSLRMGGFIGATMLSIGSLLTVTISNTNQLPFTFGALQGIGFGMMVPVCYSTLNHYFVRKRTLVMSLCKAIQGIVLMWYPQFIKLIMFSYGFRGTLLILTGISLHAFPGMASMTPRVKHRSRKRTAKDLRDKNEESNLLRDVENNAIVSKTEVPKTRGLFDKISSHILEFLSIKVWKDVVYCNICIGQSFVNFSDLTFFMLHPMLLFQYGYDVANVAMCISIGAGADVAGRCGLPLISYFTHMNTRHLFYAATFFTIIFRIVLLQVRQFLWVAVVTAVLGVLRAWLHVASPLVIADHVPHNDFPGAYAMFMLAAGVINVVCAPLIGLVKDVYQDYVPAFYALTFCCLPCLVFWPIEYLLRRK